MKLTVLSGGIGGAKFLKGLRLIPEVEVTVIVNNGDDISMHGLRICPDLDSVIYNLAGVSDLSRGWGRAEESWVVQKELAHYFGQTPWFNLGDKDFATHIFRTDLLNQGKKLDEVVATQCATWGITEKILPSTNQEVETQVELIESLEGRTSIHFQEWWVRYRCSIAARGFALAGKSESLPAPGVIQAIHDADLILFPPSNPVVSIGMILEIPGIRDALNNSNAPIIGISPIIGDHPVLGMADKCLKALGMETSATAVARLYGSRADNGLLNGWLIADSDKAQIEGIEAMGIDARAIPLMMSDDQLTKDIAQAALDLLQSAGSI